MLVFVAFFVGRLQAQSIVSLDFESNVIGDSLTRVSWGASDIQSVIVDDPLASGNNVLKNTVHNYNAAPVFMFVLPTGKSLADFNGLSFKGYFQKGDVGYKDIIAQVYQTKPTGHHFLDTDTLGIINRAQGTSSGWEDINLDITNTSSYADTIYIALGINCAGTSGSDTTTWFADDIKLLAKPAGPSGNLTLDFENNVIGDSLTRVSWGASDIQSVIVDDPLASGNNVLKNTVHNYNAAPVFMFILPPGKTLADYNGIDFDGYFQKGDIGYKDIIAQAYQTKPTGHHFLDTDTLGLINRAQGASSNWEKIHLDISNMSSFSDTIYIALGINCAGTSGSDTTTWFADNVSLIAKPEAPMNALLIDFDSMTIGDSLARVSWGPGDIQSIIADDPVAGGNNVLKNVVHNYNAAPVLKFILPPGKKLADFTDFAFKGYFQKGDVAYKDIIAQAYQTMPTGHHFLDTDTLGLFNRAKGVSSGWEDIHINISNGSTFSDTVYIAFGINCAGTSGSDTTTWFADSVALIAKIDTMPPPPITVTNGGFEESPVETIDSTTIVKGWLIQVASGLSSAPDLEIVSDTVQEGSRALKVTVNSVGTNQWDIQAVADSIHVKPNVLYDYSVWAKSDAGGAQVNFTVGNYSYSEYKVIRPASLTSQWKKFAMQFSVTDGQAVIRAPIHFSYSANVGKVIYIDNLQIVEHPKSDTGTVYNGPPLAQGQDKFLGNAYGDIPDNIFAKYWTQLTPGNAGKWGSIAGSQDTTKWNWTGLDNQYNYAMTNHLIFKDHNLIWGQQQPSWISGLDSAQQYKSIETWIRMVGQRYPNIDMIDVVNEPLLGHNPPDGINGRANYKNALGGNGATGWDWVIKSFELARKYLPKAKLLINDYGIINDNNATANYIKIINLLKDRKLIDGIGVQGHRFALENADVNTLKFNLDKLTATGLPVYISELDLGNIGDTGTPNDNTQLNLYKKIFPLLWEHPGVKGITLWGYLEGQMWQTTCYLVRSDGTARPALLWLVQYLKDHPAGVHETENALPAHYSLEQNFPNPFNPTTNIRYSIVKASKVTLKVYDILGREVQTLVNSVQAPGQYTVPFNAQNLASGVYIYQINAGNFTATKKLMLLK